MNNDIIRVENLSKQFGNFDAVNNLSFCVKEGEVYGFLGQNGAGKSTTMRMLLTLIAPTKGNINIFNKSLLKNRKEVLSNIGALIEKPDLYKYLTAYENIRLFAQLSRIKFSKNDLMNQLEKVGLGDRANDKVKKYSQGMKQRLGIAIALIHNPKLVMLDEPTNGLDPQGIADIRNLIINLSKKEGRTVVVSSHLLNEIEQVADRVLIIDKGKKIVEGTINSLIDPENTIVEIETDDEMKLMNLLLESSFNNQVKLQSHNVSLTISKSLIPDLNKFLVENNIAVYSLNQRHSLEDYFLRITKI
jgi:ABC-type multidrug transport system ATPase subunit